ncbi:MAG: RHS repeat-associated core domain-containing protein, partial [Bacteroidetes bacterium]|nr:RHS repeat-associated core domain-containing protein [Bacteroidota bacterium]
RMTLTDANNNGIFDNYSVEVLQADDYYPFGMRITRKLTSSENNYTYNGKEHENDFGLNWYHYGARYYDPNVGRWRAVDPVDEFNSPYCYVGNNPINLVDPNGMETEYYVDGKLDRIEYGVWYNPFTWKHYGFGASWNGGPIVKGAIIEANRSNFIDPPLVVSPGISPNLGEIPFKDVSNSEKYPGVKIFETPLASAGGITLPGLGIFVYPGAPNREPDLVAHEYGHFLDFSYSPDLKSSSTLYNNYIGYYLFIGIPSLTNMTGLGGAHESFPTEVRANIWAKSFGKFTPNYNKIRYPTKF